MSWCVACCLGLHAAACAHHDANLVDLGFLAEASTRRANVQVELRCPRFGASISVMHYDQQNPTPPSLIFEQTEKKRSSLAPTAPASTLLPPPERCRIRTVCMNTVVTYGYNKLTIDSPLRILPASSFTTPQPICERLRVRRRDLDVCDERWCVHAVSVHRLGPSARRGLSKLAEQWSNRVLH